MLILRITNNYRNMIWVKIWKRAFHNKRNKIAQKDLDLNAQCNLTILIFYLKCHIFKILSEALWEELSVSLTHLRILLNLEINMSEVHVYRSQDYAIKRMEKNVKNNLMHGTKIHTVKRTLTSKLSYHESAIAFLILCTQNRNIILFLSYWQIYSMTSEYFAVHIINKE